MSATLHPRPLAHAGFGRVASAEEADGLLGVCLVREIEREREREGERDTERERVSE